MSRVKPRERRFGLSLPSVSDGFRTLAKTSVKNNNSIQSVLFPFTPSWMKGPFQSSASHFDPAQEPRCSPPDHRSPENPPATVLSLSQSGCLAYLLLTFRGRFMKESQTTIMNFTGLSNSHTAHNKLVDIKPLQ